MKNKTVKYSRVPENWKGKIPKRFIKKCPDCGATLAVGVKDKRGSIELKFVKHAS